MMAAKANVLVVDDNQGLRRTMALVLQRKGHRADTAANGREALRHVHQAPYDLIFLDIRMPEMDGVQAFSEIKALRPDAAVMMITSYAVDEVVQDALRRGVRGVLRKPLDMDQVLNLVENVQHA